MDLFQVLTIVALGVGIVFLGILVVAAFKDPIAEIGLPAVVYLGIPGVVGGIVAVVGLLAVGPTLWAWLNCGPGSFTFRDTPCSLMFDTVCIRSELAPPAETPADVLNRLLGVRNATTEYGIGNVCDVSGLLVTMMPWEFLAFVVLVAFALGALVVWIPWQLIRGRPVREFE